MREGKRERGREEKRRKEKEGGRYYCNQGGEKGSVHIHT